MGLISGGAAGAFSANVTEIDLEAGGSVTNNETGSIQGSGWGVFTSGSAGSIANAGGIDRGSGFGILASAGGEISNAALGGI